MALRPIANQVDLTSLPSIIQYFPTFKAHEDTTAGRQFYRGLRELYDRMGEVCRLRRSMGPVREAEPDPSGSLQSSGERSDDDDRIEEVDPSATNPSSTSKAPVSTASTAPVGDVVKNERPVRV